MKSTDSLHISDTQHVSNTSYQDHYPGREKMLNSIDSHLANDIQVMIIGWKMLIGTSNMRLGITIIIIELEILMNVDTPMTKSCYIDKIHTGNPKTCMFHGPEFLKNKIQYRACTTLQWEICFFFKYPVYHKKIGWLVINTTNSSTNFNVI